MTSLRRLWLVRHGETEGQSSIRFHGSNDVPLSAHGRAQIAAVAPLLAGLQPARIVHSPLSRTVESARILASACGYAPDLLRVEPRLREMSFGVCEGLTAEEIAALHPEFWARRQRGEHEGFPGGERRLDFAARVQAVAHELAAGPDEDVIVVSHHGTTRQILRALLGVPQQGGDQFAVRLGSLTVARREARWAIDVFDWVPE